MADRDEIELNEFQLRNIQFLTHLLVHDAIDDEIVENLRKSELDYFSLLNKYKLLEQKVNIDEKTNLLKYKHNYLTEIIKTASRIYFGTDQSNFQIVLIRFDIDDFSIFNNKYGHETGDIVLCAFADIIRENSRPTDYVIRFGGEEFDVLLPSTTMEGAKSYLDKIYTAMEETEIDHSGESLKVTISAGVSSITYAFTGKKKIVDNEIQEIYKKLQSEADNALYEAKYLGKNRYCFYSSEKEQDYIRMRDEYVK